MPPLTKLEPLVLRPHGVFAPLFYAAVGVAFAIGAFAYAEPALAPLGLVPIVLAIAMAVRRIEVRVVDDIVTVTWHNYLTRRLPESFARSAIIAPIAGKPFGDIDGDRKLVILVQGGEIALTGIQQSGDLESAAFAIGQYLEL